MASLPQQTVHRTAEVTVRWGAVFEQTSEDWTGHREEILVSAAWQVGPVLKPSDDATSTPFLPSSPQIV